MMEKIKVVGKEKQKSSIIPDFEREILRSRWVWV
jgi:hypothetical protein